MAGNQTDSKEAELEQVSIDAARDKLGDLVIRAGIGNERFVITRHNKPTAALIGIPDLERLRSLDGAACS